MPRPLLWFAFAAFIAVMLLYRQILITIAEHYGTLPILALIAGCYVLACVIHHRETLTD